MTELVKTEIKDGVALVRFDDGKANAIGPPAIDAFHAALDQAEADSDAVVIYGREGRFSAGFDLAIMGSGVAEARELVEAGARLFMRMYGFPRPVIAGCDGHALAGGALILLSCDVRIGTDRPVKIGLPEVAIGMPLPVFATELARDRLSNRHFTSAALLATIYSPSEAVDVGFLDRIVAIDQLETTVMECATDLATRLTRSGFEATRHNTRGATIAQVEESMVLDLATFAVKPDKTQA